PYDLNWSEEGIEGQYLEDLFEGIYILEITDNNLCVFRDTSELRGVNISCLNIPTVFTPNGDHANDVWQIEYIEIYPEAIIEIYNRWGTLIYVSEKGYTNPWDGTYNGREMPIDSYHFVLIPAPGKKPVTGNVTIIR
ncbi:MAG: T9SS type B sorting domain-containing protein, partial [Bacteroidales bacterium]|nr:T9SS type B sorting domain-containing protein [Bacteroidales bacterium]